MVRHERRPALWRVMLIGFSLCGARTAGADMNGWWRVEATSYPTEIVFVSDSGVDVAFAYAGFAFSGHVSAGQLRMFASPQSGFSCSPALAASLPGPDLFQGTLLDIGLSCVGASHGQLVGERCGCFDGNAVDGDGCSARCDVEPCFTCTGDPSSCVSTQEGGTCDDGLDCTAGERCAAGVCTNGALITPCFDLSGPWRWRFDWDETAPAADSESVLSLTQRRGYLVVRGAQGNLTASGPIDPATGAFDLSSPPVYPSDYITNQPCVSVYDGQASSDGRAISGDVLVGSRGATSCALFGVALSGHRCRGEDCPVCVGDCDDDGQVVINELVTSVNIALERAAVDQCRRVDVNESGIVEVSELTTAVNRLLRGCDE